MAVIVFGNIVRPFDDDDGNFRRLSVGDDFELLVTLGDDVELDDLNKYGFFDLFFIKLKLIILKREKTGVENNKILTFSSFRQLT